MISSHFLPWGEGNIIWIYRYVGCMLVNKTMCTSKNAYFNYMWHDFGNDMHRGTAVWVIDCKRDLISISVSVLLPMSTLGVVLLRNSITPAACAINFILKYASIQWSAAGGSETYDISDIYFQSVIFFTTRYYGESSPLTAINII